MINKYRVFKITSIWFFMLCSFLGGNNAFATITSTFTTQQQAYDTILSRQAWYCSSRTITYLEPGSGDTLGRYFLRDCPNVHYNYRFQNFSDGFGSDGFPIVDNSPDPSTCTAEYLTGKASEDDNINIHSGSHTYTDPTGCQYVQSSTDVSCYADHTGSLWCTIQVTPTGETVEPPVTCTGTDTCLLAPDSAPPPAVAECATTAPQQATIDQVINGYAGTVISCESEDVRLSYWNTNLDCQRFVTVSPDGNWLESSNPDSVCSATGSSAGDYSDPNTNPDADGGGSQSGGAPGTGGSTGGSPWSGGGNTSSPGSTSGSVGGDMSSGYTGGTNPAATNEATQTCDANGNCVINFGNPADSIPTGDIGRVFSDPQSIGTDVLNMMDNYEQEKDNVFDPLTQQPYLDSVDFDALNVMPDQRACDPTSFGVDYHGQSFEPLTAYCPIHDEYVRPALAWFFAILAGLYGVGAFVGASRTL